MNGQQRPGNFTILGGALHRLGLRFGLVKYGSNSISLGLALGILPWIVLMMLALLEGHIDRILSWSLLGGHVRLLVVIPLLFLCESWLSLRADEFVRTVVRAGVIGESSYPALNREMDRVSRWSNSWVADASCFLVAALVSAFGARLDLPGATAAYSPGLSPSGLTLTGLWYWIVCLTLFRFVLARWIWRLCLWWYFLWRIARMNLQLVPAHPDRAGGLGYLETVHFQFLPLVVAISALQSAAFAEEIVAGTATFDMVYPMVVLILVVDLALFLGPLLVFTAKLWTCRLKGLSDYSELAERYVGDFEKKWLTTRAPPTEPLLGTADLQSLADLSNSVAVVCDMRVLPFGRRLPVAIVAAAIVPFLPLMLTQYPFAELAQKFLGRLTGI